MIPGQALAFHEGLFASETAAYRCCKRIRTGPWRKPVIGGALLRRRDLYVGEYPLKCASQKAYDSIVWVRGRVLPRDLYYYGKTAITIN